MTAVVRPATEDDLEGLTGVLVDCVDGGASVSFLPPLAPDRAREFWRGVAADAARGGRALLVAEDGDGIAGTVQLVLDMPENQPHRADVAKLLVHRRARGRGVGEQLVRAAEDEARRRGRTLLVLDTTTGNAAERLYLRLGWQRVGEIPGFALDADRRPSPTTVLYREL